VLVGVSVVLVPYMSVVLVGVSVVLVPYMSVVLVGVSVVVVVVVVVGHPEHSYPPMQFVPAKYQGV